MGETAYEASLNHKLDVENIYFTAHRLGHDKVLKEGRKEGLEKGKHDQAIQQHMH